MGRREDSYGGSNGASDNVSNGGVIPQIKNTQKSTQLNAPQIIGNTTKGTKFIKNHTVMNSFQNADRTGFAHSQGSQHDNQMPTSTQSNMMKQGINSSINNPLKINDSKGNLVHKSFMNAQMNLG